MSPTETDKLLKKLLVRLAKITKEMELLRTQVELGESWLTAREVAKACEVIDATVRNWVIAGKINKYSVNGRAMYKWTEVYPMVKAKKK